MKRMVQRVRQGNLPPNPKSLTDVTDIPDILKIDKDGEQWLLKFSKDHKLPLIYVI